MCDFAVHPNAKKCPYCGAELFMSNEDDPEDVAKNPANYIVSLSFWA